MAQSGTVAAGSYEEQFGELFQEHILAVAAREPGFVSRFRSALDHGYFTSDTLRIVAKSLFQFIDQYQTLPTRATLEEHVRAMANEGEFKTAEKLLKRLYTDELGDASAVRDKVIEFGKMQALVNAVLEGADDLTRGDRAKLLPRVQKALLVGEDILDIGIQWNTTDRSALYSDDSEYRETVPSGIRHIDAVMQGGLGRGELGVILAPPKRGKTTSLINFGFGALAAGFNVVHYSFEIKDKKVARRYDDRLAGKLLGLRMTDPEKFAKAIQQKAGAEVKGKLIIKKYVSRSVGVTTLRNHLSLLKSEGFNPDMVIVDYADIVKPERRLGEMRHEQAGIYEDLRALAEEFNVALWTGSQAKQSSLEKATIEMQDFAEAFEKAAIVDAALGFCQTLDEKVDHKCRFYFAALRDQEDGRTVECTIDRKRCFIQSTAVYDAAQMREVTAADKEDDDLDEEIETQRAVQKAKNVIKGGVSKDKRPRKKQTPVKKVA